MRIIEQLILRKEDLFQHDIQEYFFAFIIPLKDMITPSTSFSIKGISNMFL